MLLSSEASLIYSGIVTFFLYSSISRWTSEKETSYISWIGFSIDWVVILSLISIKILLLSSIIYLNSFSNWCRISSCKIYLNYSIKSSNPTLSPVRTALSPFKALDSLEMKFWSLIRRSPIYSKLCFSI